MSAYEASIAGRTYSFSPLVELYGARATERIAQAWEQQFIGYSSSTVQTRFRDFTRFLRWIAARAETTPASAEARFFKGVQTGDTDSLNREVVFSAGESWAVRLRDLECRDIIKTDRLASRKPLIESISVSLQMLARAGLWSDPGRLRPVCRGQIVGGNIPSLGELERVAEPEQLFGRAQPTYSEIVWKIVLKNNERRLEALRRICREQLQRGIEKFERGQAILADERIPIPTCRADLLARLRTLKVSRSQLRSRSPLPAHLQEYRYQGFGMMVRYLAFTDPHRRSFRDWRNTSDFDRAGEFGGWMEALAHLEGDTRTCLAAHTLVLIETAFNVTTCDRLAADPFVGEIQRGRVKIFTVAAAKLRSRGEIQEASLRDECEIENGRPTGPLNAATAIRAWQKLSGRIRATALLRGLPSANRLWILPGSKTKRDQIDIVTDAALIHHWVAMLKENFDDPEIGGLPIRRQMIRPTVLQLESSRNSFEHTVAATLANHRNSSSTMRYLSRPWFKALLDAKMRKYVDSFEACMLEPIATEEASIGGTEAHQARLQHGIETGLGFLCTAPRVAPATVDQEAPCIAVDQCADCGFRQFRPTSESIEAIVLLRHSLAAHAERFQAQNPARWAEVWVSFQALCEVITERLRTSRHRSELARAEAKVQQGLADGTRQLVQIW